jgi:hypothetical protein
MNRVEIKEGRNIRNVSLLAVFPTQVCGSLEADLNCGRLSIIRVLEKFTEY